MSSIQYEKNGNTAVITMVKGENRHNPDFAREIMEALNMAEGDAGVTAIVLASANPKAWSLGIDLEWMTAAFAEGRLGDIRKFMYDMNEVFKKLMLIPMPTIAAINGHAFGNGAIISCACDFRFMRKDRGFFCLPEVDLGIPFLPGMIAFCRKAIPEYKFIEMKLTGKRAGGAELEAHNVVLKASENEEELMKDALAFASTFAKKRGIFGEHKKRLTKHIVEIMDKEDPAVIEPVALFISE
jgi:enoyl-CoA hydratase/carnithine racemase